MAHYAGLDVALKETAVRVIDEAGSVVWQGKVATTMESIASILARHAGGERPCRTGRLRTDRCVRA